MKLYPLCASCNLGSMARLMDILDIRENRWGVMQKLMKIASEVPEDAKPVELYKVLYTELTGGKIIDIYKQQKQQMNHSVLQIYPWLKELVKQAEDPIKMAARLSVVGNIIDLGVHGHQWGDIKEEVEKHMDIHFFIDERDTFIDMLKNAKTIFLVADNAGEIVFDRLLLETIKEAYQEIDIKVGVRGEPLLNDVIYEDAIDAGIPREWIVDTGVDLPGFVPSHAREKALKLLEEADIVVAKGQGNFEGLSEVADSRLFFVLRAKCQPVASEWHAPVGSLIFSRLG